MRTRRSGRTPARGTVVKDVLLFMGGWGMIVQQLIFTDRGDFNTVVWLSALALVGAPGGAKFLPTLIGLITTAVRSSPSAEPVLPPSESSSQSEN